MQFTCQFSEQEKQLIYLWIKNACLANDFNSVTFWDSFSISFNTRKKRILAVAYRNSRIIEISKFFWDRATLEQKENTIKHEACHVIAFYLYGLAAAGHGKFFKICMKNCGLDGSACVNYPNVQFKGWRQKRYDAFCSCGLHPISGRVKAAIDRGVTYTCRKCHADLSLF